VSCFSYFVERAGDALLSCSDDEREIARGGVARDLNRLQVFSFVEMNSLASGTKQYKP